MLILQVQIRVKPEHLETFRAATTANAEASRREPGIARFDVLQHEDDPTRFQLIEVYRTREAIAAHKEAAHYRAWFEGIGEWQAEPRTRAFWLNVTPDDAGW